MARESIRRRDVLHIPKFGLAVVRQIRQSRLGYLISRLQLDDGRDFYLKQGKGEAAADVKAEAERLKWLQSRLPVPKVYPIKAERGETRILLEALPGRPSHHALLPERKRMEIVADALRQIHATPTRECPFRNTLDRELAEAERRVRFGLLDLDAFIKETAGVSPSQVLEQLHASRSIIHETTFTHGDYCLPNVMIHGARLSGVLDWGIAGIADPHRDFMAIWDSIDFNLGAKWIPYFFKAYGMPKPDQDRIRYYNLLDRFYAHYTLRTESER